MTAHILLPALDEDRAATLSKRIVSDLLRAELKFDGLVLTDDLEMRAIAARHTPPEAAVLALGAGCDGVLICGANHDVHAAALEAVVRAVELNRLRRSRIEDAFMRLKRAKDRFLAASVAVRPLRGRQLRQRLGCDEHRIIADEMRRFL
jgi:beta-N-acetylhexosaminidase